jgi:thiol-disulfide isomerase/thioredoxin
MFIDQTLTRIFLALLIVGAGLAAYALANRLILLRARRNQPAQALPSYQPGTPAILYFTTPECVACKSVQRPALQRLSQKMGTSLRVIEIDAQQRPDLASQWGVLSVPTTFILDPRGEPRHVNHGVTRAEKLAEQLASIQ